MYTRLSAYQLAVLYGIYPDYHDCGRVVWIRGSSVISYPALAMFVCQCGVHCFISRSRIIEILKSNQ